MVMTLCREYPFLTDYAQHCAETGKLLREFALMDVRYKLTCSAKAVRFLYGQLCIFLKLDTRALTREGSR